VEAAMDDELIADLIEAIEAARADGDKFKKPANSSTQLDLNLIGSDNESD
jgi:hypothetical protein